MSGRLRKVLLTVHLVVSVGWIGAVLAYLALGVAATTTGNGEVVRAAWVGMALTGWFVIVPPYLLLRKELEVVVVERDHPDVAAMPRRES